MFKMLKYMLFGIALILLGIYGAVFFSFAANYFFAILAVACPFIGLVLCCMGLATPRQEENTNEEETEKDPEEKD